MGRVWTEENTGFQLPEDFFEKNILKEVSPATLSAFQMDLMFDEQVLDLMRKQSEGLNSEQKKKQEQEDREMIEGIATVKNLVRCMQKLNDNLLRPLLPARADALGQEAWQEVTDRLMRSGNDTFVENSVLLLSRADDSYIDQIEKGLADIRQPYAKSEACVLLSYRKRHAALPAIMDVYEELSAGGDDKVDDFRQGPLYAIYRLMNHPVNVEENGSETGGE
ncbi:MAG: hypothetical protein K6E50_15220 [Lachnospiraceae bacterium]|nr:hypothetical protein [Lachnospiraceae bacterium]